MRLIHFLLATILSVLTAAMAFAQGAGTGGTPGTPGNPGTTGAPGTTGIPQEPVRGPTDTQRPTDTQQGTGTSATRQQGSDARSNTGSTTQKRRRGTNDPGASKSQDETVRP